MADLSLETKVAQTKDVLSSLSPDEQMDVLSMLPDEARSALAMEFDPKAALDTPGTQPSPKGFLASAADTTYDNLAGLFPALWGMGKSAVGAVIDDPRLLDPHNIPENALRAGAWGAKQLYDDPGQSIQTGGEVALGAIPYVGAIAQPAWKLGVGQVRQALGDTPDTPIADDLGVATGDLVSNLALMGLGGGMAGALGKSSAVVDDVAKYSKLFPMMSKPGAMAETAGAKVGAAGGGFVGNQVSKHLRTPMSQLTPDTQGMVEVAHRGFGGVPSMIPGELKPGGNVTGRNLEAAELAASALNTERGPGQVLKAELGILSSQATTVPEIGDKIDNIAPQIFQARTFRGGEAYDPVLGKFQGEAAPTTELPSVKNKVANARTEILNYRSGLMDRADAAITDINAPAKELAAEMRSLSTELESFEEISNLPQVPDEALTVDEFAGVLDRLESSINQITKTDNASLARKAELTKKLETATAKFIWLAPGMVKPITSKDILSAVPTQELLNRAAKLDLTTYTAQGAQDIRDAIATVTQDFEKIAATEKPTLKSVQEVMENLNALRRAAGQFDETRLAAANNSRPGAAALADASFVEALSGTHAALKQILAGKLEETVTKGAAAKRMTPIIQDFTNLPKALPEGSVGDHYLRINKDYEAFSTLREELHRSGQTLSLGNAAGNKGPNALVTPGRGVRLAASPSGVGRISANLSAAGEGLGIFEPESMEQMRQAVQIGKKPVENLKAYESLYNKEGGGFSIPETGGPVTKTLRRMAELGGGDLSKSPLFLSLLERQNTRMERDYKEVSANKGLDKIQMALANNPDGPMVVQKLREVESGVPLKRTMMYGSALKLYPELRQIFGPSESGYDSEFEGVITAPDDQADLKLRINGAVLTREMSSEKAGKLINALNSFAPVAGSLPRGLRPAQSKDSQPGELVAPPTPIGFEPGSVAGPSPVPPLLPPR